MSPWVPPYFGSWEHLVQLLLHNPFLGGGGVGPHGPFTTMEYTTGQQPVPNPWRAADAPSSALGRVLGPSPQPWHGMVSMIISAISMKDLASRINDKQAKGELTSRAEKALSTLIDDCGTPPHRWPWPGPPPWSHQVVEGLTLVAHSLQEGSLRNEIPGVAGQIAEKSIQAAR